MMPVPTCKIFEKLDQLRGHFKPGRVDSKGLGQKPSHGGQAVTVGRPVAQLSLFVTLSHEIYELNHDLLSPCR